MHNTTLHNTTISKENEKQYLLPGQLLYSQKKKPPLEVKNKIKTNQEIV